MNDRLIAVSDIHIGMVLAYDIQDNYGRLLLKRHTVITEEILHSLTATGLSYLLYENAEAAEDKFETQQIDTFLAFVAQITFLGIDDIYSLMNIERGDLAAFTADTNELVDSFHNAAFHNCFNQTNENHRDRAASVLTRITERFMAMYDSGWFNTFDFYYEGLDMLRTLNSFWMDQFKKIYTPYPAGTIVTIEANENCLVIDVFRDEPENPLIKPILAGNSIEPYFINQTSKKIIAVEPLAVVLPHSSE